MKVSNSAVANSPVWLDAGIHAREWIAPAVNTFIADFIVRNFWSLPECFTNKDWLRLLSIKLYYLRITNTFLRISKLYPDYYLGTFYPLLILMVMITHIKWIECGERIGLGMAASAMA